MQTIFRLKTPLILIVVSILLTACSLGTGGRKTFSPQTTNTSQNGIIIEFKNDTYTPNTATIKVGQRVTFNNKSDHAIWPASNIHPTHGIYPEFDPKVAVQPGDSWSFTFTRIGTWKFHDHLKPEIVGEITVNP